MLLYTYFRSSASYRVRIALQWKGIAAEYRFVDLRPHKHDQLAPEYAALNPQRLVPLLIDRELKLNQSLAILEYLEEQHPEPALLPGAPEDRARVRALAAMVCCDVQPLQNVRVQRYLASELGHEPAAVSRWVRHWIDDGLAALESMIAEDPARGAYCHGDRPSFADVCLVPQLYNAARAGCDLTRYPTLIAIRDACDALAAFRAARPENQPDARLPNEAKG